MDNYAAFAKALAFAAEKHKNQTRKDGRPYIYHPIGVAQLICMSGHGLKYQIVALLHDVLEDTDATENDLEIFGSEIVSAVKALTRVDGESDDEHLNKVLNNKIARLVKGCDVINNMYDTLLCDDPEWVNLYVRKASLKYSGRLCKAADMSIEMALRCIDDCPEKTPVPSFTKEELTPYVCLQ